MTAKVIMAIGVVSDNDFLTEINKAEKSPVPELKPAQVVELPRPGRNEGDNNVPESIRNVIAQEYVENGRASAKEFAKFLDVSDSSVSAYSKGSTSTKTYNKENNKLGEALKHSRLKIATKVGKRLHMAINNMTEDKFNEAKLTDLAIVAKHLSGIIKDMEPPSEKADNISFNGPSIVMYNPGFAKESSFETVELNEAE